MAPKTQRNSKTKKAAVSKREEPASLRELFLWIAARGEEIPPEERAAIPKDLARNHEHYLYGHPKQ